MKKIIFLFLLLFVSLPVFASNWVQIAAKGNVFIDVDSVRKENYLRPNVYSIWEKLVNDNSSYFINLERLYGKRVEYILQKVLIDCNTKEYKVDSATYYDLQYNPISYNDYTYLYSYNDIVPGSIAETKFNVICGVNDNKTSIPRIVPLLYNNYK